VQKPERKSGQQGRGKFIRCCSVRELLRPFWMNMRPKVCDGAGGARNSDSSQISRGRVVHVDPASPKAWQSIVLDGAKKNAKGNLHLSSPGEKEIQTMRNDSGFSGITASRQNGMRPSCWSRAEFAHYVKGLVLALANFSASTTTIRPVGCAAFFVSNAIQDLNGLNPLRIGPLVPSFICTFTPDLTGGRSC
jgi:hypothetical protein